MLVGLAAVGAYSWIGLFRFQHFGANAFDLGNQDQAVWGYSQLRIIPDSLLGIRSILGDHFNPILATLGPLYWVWNDAQVLLVAQAAIIAASSLPLYAWSAPRLGWLSALCIQAAYLLFWGVLAGIVFDFHHVVFAVFGVSLAIYGVRARRDRLLWAAVAITLLTREDVALVTATLGVYLVVLERRWITGSVLSVVSVVWFVVAVRLVIPAIRQAPYGHWEYAALGSGPLAALAYVVTHPVDAARIFFLPLQKTRTLAVTLAAWCLVPLLSTTSVLLIPVLAPRFWSSDPFKWSTHFQYTLLAAPILAFAATDPLVVLRRSGPGRGPIATWLALAILAVNVVFSVVIVKPLSELSGYVSGARAAQIQGCLNTIPGQASVSATNFLVPHLSHRDAIYLFPAGAASEYIAVDLATEGIAPIESGRFLPVHPKATAVIALRTGLQQDLRDGYGIACSRGTTLVLARGRTGGALSDEIAGFLAATGGA